MKQTRDFDEAVDAIVARDSRYHPDAYAFVRDALDYTLKDAAEAEGGKGRHVSGPELLDGFRSYALGQFGPMVLTVFEEWGLGCTRDVGEIVFNLIEAGIFGKTDSDTIEDFTGIFGFEEVFTTPFLPRAVLEDRERHRSGQLADS